MAYISPTLQEMTPVRFWLILTPQMVYFEKQINTREVPQTDRQTDILLTEIKVITDVFVIVIREIYVHVYTRMLVC